MLSLAVAHGLRTSLLGVNFDIPCSSLPAPNTGTSFSGAPEVDVQTKHLSPMDPLVQGEQVVPIKGLATLAAPVGLLPGVVVCHRNKCSVQCICQMEHLSGLSSGCSTGIT